MSATPSIGWLLSNESFWRSSHIFLATFAQFGDLVTPDDEVRGHGAVLFGAPLVRIRTSPAYILLHCSTVVQYESATRRQLCPEVTGELLTRPNVVEGRDPYACPRPVNMVAKPVVRTLRSWWLEPKSDKLNKWARIRPISCLRLANTRTNKVRLLTACNRSAYSSCES